MESLRMLWQTYGKARGAVIKMCAAMDNHWSTSQMSRNLKAMGLLVCVVVVQLPRSAQYT